MFDAARGRRARAAFEQARLAGRNAEAKEVAGAMRRTAPPQIVVRCQFCATNIAPSKGAGMLGELNEAGRGAGAQLGVKVRLQLVLLSPSLRLGAGELTFLSLSLPAVDALPVVQQAGPGVLHLPRATVAALVRRSRSCVSLSLSLFSPLLFVLAPSRVNNLRSSARSCDPLLVPKVQARRARFAPPRLVRECVLPLLPPPPPSLPLVVQVLTFPPRSRRSFRGVRRRRVRLRVQPREVNEASAGSGPSGEPSVAVVLSYQLFSFSEPLFAHCDVSRVCASANAWREMENLHGPSPSPRDAQLPRCELLSRTPLAGPHSSSE